MHETRPKIPDSPAAPVSPEMNTVFGMHGAASHFKSVQLGAKSYGATTQKRLTERAAVKSKAVNKRGIFPQEFFKDGRSDVSPERRTPGFLKKHRSKAERRYLLRKTDKYIGRTADNILSPVAEKAYSS